MRVGNQLHMLLSRYQKFAAIGVLLLVAACHPAVKSTLPGPPTRSQIAQLWVEPASGRDLYWGVGGKGLAPDPAATYTVLEIKRTGFSPGYTVAGPDKRQWSAKLPPEAPTEVVASRIHLGPRLPPAADLLPAEMAGREDDLTQPATAGALPREESCLQGGFEDTGPWSYYQNPFVGTRELKGLLVLQAMLGNSDLKDENNATYVLAKPFEGARTWYVARDLGHTFGRTGVLGAPRGDLEVFERTPFITGVGQRPRHVRLARPPRCAARRHHAG